MNLVQVLPFDLIYVILSYLPLCQNHPLAKGAKDSNTCLIADRVNKGFKPLWSYGCIQKESYIAFIQKWKLTSVNLRANCNNHLNKNDVEAILQKFNEISTLSLAEQGIDNNSLSFLNKLPLASLDLAWCRLCLGHRATSP